MRIVLFDDDPSALLPFTYMRPSWDVNVGGITLNEWLQHLYPRAEIITQRGAYRPAEVTGAHLALNGRMLPSRKLAARIARMQADARLLQVRVRGELACVYADGKGGDSAKETDEDITIATAPWHIVAHLSNTLALSATLKKKGLRKARPGVFVGKGVKLSATVVTRSEHGPVVIGEGTTFGAFVVLEGPLIIGTHCIVRDHTMLARAAIGDVCKVGGEIEDAVIDAYSNKQHYGYVGHSVIGSWVNLGAGTTTSDLKHTYGIVRADRGAGKEETGLQFCGSFIGDGVKTAINTALMSGAVLGLNAFAFGTVQGFVPSFTSLTSRGLIEMPLAVALRMRERMMKRRSVSFTAPERQTFTALYARTAPERDAHSIARNVPLAI